MKFIFCTIVASFLLIGCSSDGDDNDAPIPLPDEITDNGAVDIADDDAVVIVDDGAVEAPVSDIPSVEYMDSFISLRYPASWLLNPNGPVNGVDAQFFAPQTNDLGGSDNCNVTSIFDPSVTLVAASEELLVFFDPVPEPFEEFLEVNGVPAARITGSFSAFGVQIPTIAQILSLNGLQVLTICAGFSDDAFDLILNSVIIN